VKNQEDTAPPGGRYPPGVVNGREAGCMSPVGDFRIAYAALLGAALRLPCGAI
jgi:hypothetical protein